MRKTWAAARWAKAAALTLVACCAQHAAAVNKCTLADGATVYQDAPCTGGKSADKVNLTGAGSAQPGSHGAQYWQRESARLARVSRIETAIANGRIIIGMTAGEALQAWGQPSTLNSTVGTYGRREQWVYRRGNAGAQYVYVDDGLVTAVQTTQ